VCINQQLIRLHCSFCCRLCQGSIERLLSNSKYSRTPPIRINWDGEPSGYAENPDYWIFLSKYVTVIVSWERYRTPLECGRDKQESLAIRINRDREPSGYAENADYWIFLSKIGHCYCQVGTI